MCGIVGLFDKSMGKAGRDLFAALLYHGVVRGAHSTGVMALSKGVCDTYKKAVPSYDFLEMGKAVSTILKADLGLVGHNRHATMGGRTSVNAHPFTHENITLVHNGTLTNKKDLPDSKSFDTDSESIAWYLSIEDPIKVLEELQGAYALVWYDSATNCVNVAKNQERPLHLFGLRKYKNSPKSYALCSEEAMGTWVIGRSNTYDIEDHSEIRDGILYQMDISTHDITTQEFTIKKEKPSYQSGYRGGKTMRMVVDAQDSTRIYCSTMDGLREVTLYKQGQSMLTNVEQDDIIEGSIGSISGNVVYMQAHSCRVVLAKKHQSPSLPKTMSCQCGICGKDFVQDDWDNNNWDLWTDNSVVHTDCLEGAMNAAGDYVLQ